MIHPLGWRTHSMRSKQPMILTSTISLALGLALATSAFTQRGGGNPETATATQADDPVKTLAGRLELEKYKDTLRGLAQFGDRRQGTERNRKAVDWIEAQLKNYGCANVERIKYVYPPASPQPAEAD